MSDVWTFFFIYFFKENIFYFHLFYICFSKRIDISTWEIGACLRRQQTAHTLAYALQEVNSLLLPVK